MDSRQLFETKSLDSPVSNFIILGRSIFLISLPFGILVFVLPIYGKSIGAGALETFDRGWVG